MYTYLSKTIINILDKATNFVRKNVAQIIIITSTFVVLEVIQSLPYINIIPRYQFLVIGFVLVLSVILLRVSISNKKIILAVLSLFVIAALTTILDLKPVSNLIGFIIFVLLSLMILRQIFQERKQLKDLDLE